MKKDLVRTRPFTWQQDTTFGTNREGYKMFLSLHKSAITGQFEIDGILFLATETRDNVEKGLTFWKESLPYTQEQVGGKFNIFVDKDFSYIDVLEKLFPGCNIHLCSVHVEQYIKDKVLPSARLETGEAVDKSDILEKFKSVRDSHAEDQYELRKTDRRPQHCQSSYRPLEKSFNNNSEIDRYDVTTNV